MKTIRKQAAVRALLDEYWRALSDLKMVIEHIPYPVLTDIADPDTADENCRSIQTILTHVVSSGYGYACYINNSRTDPIRRPEKVHRESIKEYLHDLDLIFEFTVSVFAGIEDDDLEQHDSAQKLKSPWGQWYDIEQMMEHAIVHILRHRRQIENMIRKEWTQ